MILGKYAYESITTIIEAIRVEKGNDAVKTWCIDYGMDMKECSNCKIKTPFIQNISISKCTLCNEVKQNE